MLELQPFEVFFTSHIIVFMCFVNISFMSLNAKLYSCIAVHALCLLSLPSLIEMASLLNLPCILSYVFVVCVKFVSQQFSNFIASKANMHVSGN